MLSNIAIVPQGTVAVCQDAPALLRQYQATRDSGGNPFATNCQLAALSDALTQGPDALLAYAKKERAAREERARKEWRNYALYYPFGVERSVRATGVVKKACGTVYAQVDLLDTCPDLHESCPRFPACPDQAFCDLVNGLLRGEGLGFRVYPKHLFILQHLRDAEMPVWN